MEMARIVGEVRPRHVFVENSPVLTSRGLGRVLGDLAAMGFDANWGVLGAHHAGAPHKRDRIWIVALDRERMADADGPHDEGVRRSIGVRSQHANPDSAGWWASEPDMGRVADGVAARIHRLRAIGNGQVPAVAALAWRALTGGNNGSE